MKFWHRLKRKTVERAARRRRTGWGPVVLGMLMTAVVFAVAAPPATALTRAQAENSANYYGYVDCPHHRSGLCKDSEGYVLYGVGNGRWKIQTRGWECYAWEPCAFIGGDRTSRRNASRWYYTRDCFLDAAGNRYSCSGFTNDG
jgi:hypothetical protein